MLTEGLRVNRQLPKQAHPPLGHATAHSVVSISSAEDCQACPGLLQSPLGLLAPALANCNCHYLYHSHDSTARLVHCLTQTPRLVAAFSPAGKFNPTNYSSCTSISTSARPSASRRRLRLCQIFAHERSCQPICPLPSDLRGPDLSLHLHTNRAARVLRTVRKGPLYYSENLVS